MRVKLGELYPLLLTGVVVGAGAIVLIALGNPEHVGLCLSCFISSTAGALGLHQNELIQFPRPELIGILLGAFLLAVIRTQYRPRPTRDTLMRFVVGCAMMLGCTVFLGCPMRAVFRMSFGDFSVVWGIIGFIAGVWLATSFEVSGFYLQEGQKQERAKAAWVIPLIGIVPFAALISGGLGLRLSQQGPGAVYAPVFLTLLFGIIIGALGQRSRLCVMAAVKNLILARDIHVLTGIGAIVLSATIANMVIDDYMFGFHLYPGTNTQYLWDFLSMFLVGLGAVLANGCPFRTIVRAGQGDMGAVPVLAGMIVAGGLAETLGIASSSEGITFAGRIGVLVSIAVLVLMAIVRLPRDAT